MRTVQRHSRRLAWASLASLLLHLALVGDLARLPWRQDSVSLQPTPPLEVQLTPVAGQQDSPVAIKPHFRQAESSPLLEVVPAMHNRWPYPEDVIPTDPAPAKQDAVADDPIENLGVQLPRQEEYGRIARRLPPSGKLVYQFFWGKSRWLAGLATHQWVVGDGNYILSSTVSTTGLFGLIRPLRLVETSQGTLAGDDLRPQMFITQLDEHPPAIVYFNWNKGYLRWYRGTSSFTQALPAAAHDKISFLYQLYLTPLKESLYSTDITMGRRLEHYEIRNLGVDEVDIDGKTYPAIHLKRATTSAEMEQVEIWLSAGDKLPIKMLYSNAAGDHFEQLIAADSIPVQAADDGN